MSRLAVVTGFDRAAGTLRCHALNDGPEYPTVLDSFGPTPPLATVALSEDATPRVLGIVNRVEPVVYEHWHNTLATGIRSNQDSNGNIVGGDVVWGDHLWELTGTGGNFNPLLVPKRPLPIYDMDAAGCVELECTFNQQVVGVMSPPTYAALDGRAYWARARVKLTAGQSETSVSMSMETYDQAAAPSPPVNTVLFRLIGELGENWKLGTDDSGDVDTGLEVTLMEWVRVEVVSLPEAFTAFWLDDGDTGVFAEPLVGGSAVTVGGDPLRFGLRLRTGEPVDGAATLRTLHCDYLHLGILDSPADPNLVNLQPVGA